MSKKIAVIGAGISGLQTACLLAREGNAVSVYEKQEFPPTNPSSMAGGMLSPFSEIETLPMRFVQVGIKGIALWEDILGEDIAQTILKKSGSLIIAHPNDEHMLERFAHNLQALTAEWSWIGRDRIAEIEPGLKDRFQKGIYFPDEAFLLPEIALKALAAQLKVYGGEIIQEDVTPESLQSSFDWVIDCRGYAQAFDKDLRGVLGEIILVRNKEFHLERPVRLMHPRYPLYIIPRPDHIFAIGATMIESAGEDDGLVILRSAMELLSAAYTLHPSFGDAKIVQMNAGIRAAYPDNLPRIKIEEKQGYIRCNGLFRHGYLLSPVMSRCIAHYITTGEENEDFDLFSGRHNFSVVVKEQSVAG